MKERRAQSQITISGVVTATDWDEHGDVIAVAISTEADEEYFVYGDAMGRELLQLPGAKVVVTGIAGEDNNGHMTIAVRKYEVLEEEEEEEFEEEEEEYGEGEEFEEEEEFIENEEFEEEEFEEEEEP